MWPHRNSGRYPGPVDPVAGGPSAAQELVPSRSGGWRVAWPFPGLRSVRPSEDRVSLPGGVITHRIEQAQVSKP